MTKEDFLEHMGEVIYRIQDEELKIQLWDAVGRYRQDRPSAQDEQIIRELDELNKEIVKSIETLVREINTENLMKKEMQK